MITSSVDTWPDQTNHLTNYIHFQVIKPDFIVIKHFTFFECNPLRYAGKAFDEKKRDRLQECGIVNIVGINGCTIWRRMLVFRTNHFLTVIRHTGPYQFKQVTQCWAKLTKSWSRQIQIGWVHACLAQTHLVQDMPQMHMFNSRETNLTFNQHIFKVKQRRRPDSCS